jgi:DNA (cytosine-5)-methyltransferase 1
MPKRTMIELCAGGGGLSSGLIQSGFVPLLLNDNNKDCCSTLELNHPGVKVVCSSFADIDFTEYIDKVDLLANGTPCQSYSISGKRKGLEDPRGQLIYSFIDIIYIIRPKIFLIENVKGLLNHNSGETIKEILTLLNRNNEYNIVYKLLNAVNYGVAQKRERVFIIGTRISFSDLPFEFPKPSSDIITLKDVLNDVPESLGAKYSAEKIRLFKLIPQNGCWINLPEDEQKQYLGNSFNSPGGKRGILKRLSMNEPSLTLLCSPSQKQTERCHPLLERPLTVREYARIQTFSDDYTFSGGIISQYKQIGNAVPCELARRMGMTLRKWIKKLK